MRDDVYIIAMARELGQFYSTNADHILAGFVIPQGVPIIEPFAGKGDLIAWARREVEAFDIDPKAEGIVVRDTLLDPPSYAGKFIITNPPYLARNKCSDKRVFDKYGVNDLYKCFIRSIIADVALGGIAILPLNFISSIRSADIGLRRDFLEKYVIARINIFEERVFDDTPSAICAIQFTAGNGIGIAIDVRFFPSDEKIMVRLNETNSYIVGGEIYDLDAIPQIDRLVRRNVGEANTCIVVKCIDDSLESPIEASVVAEDEIYVDKTAKQSARSYMTPIIRGCKKLTNGRQKKIVARFNEMLNEWRVMYHSLFLPNYRECNGIARKRISFGLIYIILWRVLDEMKMIKN